MNKAYTISIVFCSEYCYLKKNKKTETEINLTLFTIETNVFLDISYLYIYINKNVYSLHKPKTN